MLLQIIAVCAIIHQASGHGRMMEPVSRSSAWRLGFPTPKNYDDNALFCGGFSTRISHGDKCGVCGDPWVRDGAQRENEAGGTYAKGVIVKKYKMGQTINIKIDLTANHFGWMEYRICPNNDVTRPVTHECLNKHVLQRADGTGTKTQVNNKRTGVWRMDYKLPDAMTCTQCVLQWKYHAGNSWGVDRDTGKACIGCGDQEEFYGCSDIAIEGNGGLPQPVTGRPTPRPTPRPTQRPTQRPTPRATQRPTQRPTPRPTQRPTQRPTPRATQRPTQSPIGHTQGPIGFIPLGQKMQTNQPAVQTPKEFIGMKTQCKGINNWANDPVMDRWCTDSCATGNCPVYGCDCSGGTQIVTDKMTQPPKTTIRPTTPTTRTTTTTTTQKPTSSSSTTTTTPKPTTTSTTTTTTATKPTPAATQLVTRVECKAINLWAGNEYLDRWCADHCARGDCPPEECKCITKQKVVTQSTTTTLLPERVKPVAKTTTKVCHALSLWKGIAVFDQWCNDNCNTGTCPKDTCECTEVAEQPISTTTTSSTTTTIKPDMTSHGKCSSNGVVSGDYWDGWCQQSCDRGNCENDYCVCNL